jgi:hypothetical protein
MTTGVFVQADYNRITKNALHGMVLSQLMYWMKRRTYWFQKEKYIVKTMPELADELGLKTKVVERAVRQLEELGFIKKQCATEFGKKHSFIKVHLKKIWTLLWQVRQGKSTQNNAKQSSKIDFSKQSKVEKSTLQSSKIDFSKQSKVEKSTFSVSEIISSETLIRDYNLSDLSNLPSSDQKQKTDDDGDNDLIFNSYGLSEEKISQVTKRVLAEINSRAGTLDPIRNPQKYLESAMKKESANVAVVERLSSQTRVSPNYEPRLGTWDLDIDSPKPVADVPKNDTWDSTLEKMRTVWDESNFSTWLEPTWFKEQCEDKFVVEVPNVTVCDYLQYRAYNDVKQVLSDIVGREMAIEYRVNKRMT